MQKLLFLYFVFFFFSITSLYGNDSFNLFFRDSLYYPTASFMDLTHNDNYLFVCDGSTGIRVFTTLWQPQHPKIIHQVGIFELETARKIEIVNQTCFVLNDLFFFSIDVSNPQSAVQLGIADIGNWYGKAISHSFVVSGDLVYLTYHFFENSRPRLQVINISNLSDLVFRGSDDIWMSLRDIAVQGDKAYICAREMGMRVFDLADPGNPQQISAFTKYNTCFDQIDANNKYLYIHNHERYNKRKLHGFVVLDISNPLDPREVLDIPHTSGYTVDSKIIEDKMYISTTLGNLLIYNVEDGNNPYLIAYAKVSELPLTSVDVYDQMVICSDANHLYQFELSGTERYIEMDISADLDTVLSKEMLTVNWDCCNIARVRFDVKSEDADYWIFLGDTASCLRTYSLRFPNRYIHKARLKISDNSNPDVYDISDMTFTVLPDSTITIINPVNGQSLPYGNYFPIEWESKNIDRVSIYYSGNNGQYWNTIVENLENSGVFYWLLPHLDLSGQYKVKISNQSNPAICSVSPGFFRIIKSASDWTMMPPLANKIRDLSFVSADTGYILSDDKTIFRTDDGSKSWEEMYRFTENVRAMHFLDCNLGFVVGDNGRIWKTVDRATSFESVNTPTNDILSDIVFPSEDIGIAVGGEQTQNSLKYGLGYSTYGTVLVSADGGATWNYYTVGNKGLTSVDAIDEQFAICSGPDGWVYKIENLGQNIFVIQNGSSGFMGGYDDCMIVADQTCIVAGKNYWSGRLAMISRNAGQDWNVFIFGGSTTTEFGAGYCSAIGFRNSSAGYVFGDYIWRTQDGANRWSITDTLSRLYIDKTDFPTSEIGYAVGYDNRNGVGVVLKYGEIYPTAIDIEEKQIVPDRNVVCMNYPNPFNSSTRICFFNDEKPEAELKLNVFDLQGRIVTQRILPHIQPGYNEYEWFPVGDNGRDLPTGLYFYTIGSVEKINGKLLFIK